MKANREIVVDEAFTQAAKAMADLGDDAKGRDRLAAVRAVTALLEASEGKRTMVEHRYPAERVPAVVGDDAGVGAGLE